LEQKESHVGYWDDDEVARRRRDEEDQRRVAEANQQSMNIAMGVALGAATGMGFFPL
jgi:hypothetical protein